LVVLTYDHSFDHISLILAGREAFFSSVKKQNYLSAIMRLDMVDCHIFEVKCVRHSLKLSRSHVALQPALDRAMYLSRLVKEGAAIGLAFDDMVSYDFAGVLYDQGEMMASIQMLKQLKYSPHRNKQAIAVSRPALLADLVCTHGQSFRAHTDLCRVIALQRLD
jgi:serine-protein kinase ATM